MIRLNPVVRASDCVVAAGMASAHGAHSAPVARVDACSAAARRLLSIHVRRETQHPNGSVGRTADGPFRGHFQRNTTDSSLAWVLNARGVSRGEAPDQVPGGSYPDDVWSAGGRDRHAATDATMLRARGSVAHGVPRSGACRVEPLRVGVCSHRGRAGLPVLLLRSQPHADLSHGTRPGGSQLPSSVRPEVAVDARHWRSRSADPDLRDCRQARLGERVCRPARLR